MKILPRNIYKHVYVDLWSTTNFLNIRFVGETEYNVWTFSKAGQLRGKLHMDETCNRNQVYVSDEELYKLYQKYISKSNVVSYV